MEYYPQITKGKPYKNRRLASSFGGIVGNRPSHKDINVINDGIRYPYNVIEIDKGNHGSLHPTQKPVALFDYLIRTYTQAGDVVFDPCVGSGTTALAARNTGRNFIVGDSSEEYVNVARARLAKPYTVPMFDEPVAEPVAEQMTLELE